LWFSSVPPGICGNNILNKAMTAFFTILPINCSLISLSFDGCYKIKYGLLGRQEELRIR
jgi:hypothetical protein